MTSFSSDTAFLWLDGSVVSVDDAAIYPSDRGFLLGDGLYETFRVSGSSAPHLDLHWARLKQGCDLLRMTAPEKKRVEQALRQLCDINQLEEGSARLTITRGTGPRGLPPPANPRPTVMLTLNSLSRSEPTPARVMISSHRRDSHSILNRIKSTNALASILARIEAVEQKADDALLLNERGMIAETTAANFLALWNGQIVTPFTQDGALPGISRQRLIEAGLCSQASLSPADLTAFKGGWLVTALNLIPICQIGSVRIPLCPDRTRMLRHFLY
ncbi:aminotransferase class IV [Acetobacteraceae bacterium ESL0709]|nr:aminotransferase class IV [Acetobacteraceae bacterium ESL0697]MDF7678871.1 aminotransferase class IV [Acetobacteraceae bacterium ESL0709]